MKAASDQTEPLESDLELAANEAIAACGGDAREAVKALIVANDFLEAQLDALRKKVSTGYARGRLPGARQHDNTRMRQMAEVTYYVALPFVFSDDGVAAGDPAECLSGDARGGALPQAGPCWRHRFLADRGSIQRRLQRRQADPEVR